MAAPKGNKFWMMRSKHGRDKIFTDPAILWESCCEYFEWMEGRPIMEEKVFHSNGEITRTNVAHMRAMTITSLCLFLDIAKSTWAEYRKDKAFSGVITSAEKVIYSQKFEGASANLLNANIIARDLGLADKRDLQSSDGSMSPTRKASEMTDDELAGIVNGDNKS